MRVESTDGISAFITPSAMQRYRRRQHPMNQKGGPRQALGLLAP